MKFKPGDRVKVVNVRVAGGPGMIGKIGTVLSVKSHGLPYTVNFTPKDMNIQSDMAPSFAESELELVSAGAAHA